jgi:calmodulin
MVEQLTAEELAEFREIFNLVDRDGGGTISQAELGELMVRLRIRSIRRK